MYSSKKRLVRSYFEQKLIRFKKYCKKHELKIQVDLNTIINYINLLYNNKQNIIYNDKNISNPKISFITTVFNKDHYLSNFINNIQIQILKDFELIIIDDFSTDDSVKIIDNYQQKDNRIKLMKNKKNKGTFYSRINGLLHARGEYIIWIDPDDIIFNKGIYNSYNYIKKYKLSIIQFNTIVKKNEMIKIKYNRIFPNVIRQPYLSYIFFYNSTSKTGGAFNTALWDKLIERKIANKAINFIGKKYLKQRITIENDVILLFSLFQISDSYQHINETGYFYIRTNNDSIWNIYNNTKMCGKILKGISINIRFLFEKSEKTYLGKLYCIFKFKQSLLRYRSCYSNAYKLKEYSIINQNIKFLSKTSDISINDKIIISIISSLYHFN